MLSVVRLNVVASLTWPRLLSIRLNWICKLIMAIVIYRQHGTKWRKKVGTYKTPFLSLFLIFHPHIKSLSLSHSLTLSRLSLSHSLSLVLSLSLSLFGPLSLWYSLSLLVTISLFCLYILSPLSLSLFNLSLSSLSLSSLSPLSLPLCLN